MKITNLTSQEFFLGFISDAPKGIVQDVSSNGVKLPANGEIIVDDRYRSNPSLEGMIEEGLVSVSSLSVSNKVDSEFASANELHEFVRGLFAIQDTWANTGAIGASPTPADLESAEEGPFDTTRYNVLSLRFDDLESQEIRIELPRGQVPKASLVAALNANADFAAYAVANDLGGGSGWNIETRTLGVNANIEVLDVEGSIAELLGLVDGTLTAGTGTVAIIDTETFNASGSGISGLSHDIKLYTTDFPGLVVDANHQIQRVEIGNVISGLYSAEATIETGDEGKIKLEVAQVSAGTAPFYGVDIPAAYFLAQHPANRLDLS